MNKNHPLGRDFLELRRKTAKGYTCPVCAGKYPAEPKLWDHGVRDHPGYIEDLRGMEKAEGGARERFRQEALDQTQQRTIKTSKASLAPTDRPAGSNPSPDRNRNTGGYAGSTVKAGSPARPVSAPGYSEDPEKRIEENIGGLSLEQARLKEQKDRPSSLSNPRKRGVEGESRSTDAPIGGYTFEPVSLEPRHGKTSSGARDPDFLRQDGLLDDPDYGRGTSGPKQPLWDPGTDSPHTAKAVRRDKHRSQVNPLRPFHPLGEYHASSQGPELAPAKDVFYPRPDFGLGKPLLQRNIDGSVEQMKQPHSPEANQRHRNSHTPPQGHISANDPLDSPEGEPEMLLQPETRPISHEQLVVEVKGIYAGLVMVEAKCIDIDERQSAAAQEKDPSKKTELKNDQWQSLIALHKQLLHEHHDFFLASQHPSASQSLSRLAAKYSMPARMWRHGIHAFLEVLRHRLPNSLEHMLAFIYIAYSMMALLYETVPAFEDTWIECLGDLGRYRMAIEDDEPRDREVWSNVAKFWYNKASDKTPNVGRLYHHLAILARPYTLEQLSLYTRSLTCVNPFDSAKGSIMTLFNPILQNKDVAQRRPSSFETVFIRAHAIFFTSKPTDSPDSFNETIDELEKGDLLDTYISRAGPRFKETGAYAAISNIAALFEYGASKDGASRSRLRSAFEDAHKIREEAKKFSPTDRNVVANLPPAAGPPQFGVNHQAFEATDSRISISQPSRLAAVTLDICLKRPKDINVFPLVHIYLGFLWGLVIVLKTCKYFEQDNVLTIIEKDIPWISLCSFLTSLVADPQCMTTTLWREDFPEPVKETCRPLPEDFMMRGQLYTQWYFTASWFTAFMADDNERSHDLPSMAQPRKERLLWLGLRIASADRWIRFDKENSRFLTTERVDALLASDIEPKTVSHEQDIVMSDAGATEFTPRTMSVAPTESLETSRESTRASTPTEVFDSDPIALPVTPKAGDIVAASDDVPMMDISPGRDEQAFSLMKTDTVKEI